MLIKSDLICESLILWAF